MKKISAILAVFALLAIFAGCSKAPDAEMGAAQASLTAAQQSEAETYAPDALRMAQDTLNAATAAKTEQDGKFALFRSYGASKDMYVRADALLKQASQTAATEKEKVRAQVEALLTEAQAVLDSTNAALAKAPIGKGNKADIELIKNDLAGVGTQFGDAQADYNGGRYMVAKGKVEAVITKARSLMGEIAAAAQKKKMGSAPK
jgi:ElaB/YqjD/DUF883 family membrane-anchored ribosome-binding protein